MKLDEAARDLQLALYALACSEVPELAALGDVSEVVYLYPRLTAYGKMTRRGQEVTAGLRERTRDRVRDDVAQVVAERFEFSPEADCHWCEFKPICPRHHGRDVPL